VTFLRRYLFVIALIAIVGATRFAILLLSQTHVHSDEAIIGLMGKHILEGRNFPFYMYGQPYNAAAAGEAYLAVAPFKLFGVGVIELKSVIVVLSLLCLLLFYKMTRMIYEERTAIFATMAFAVAPSLLKWHFQVRGYSFYFLSIPVLMILFWSIVTAPRDRNFLLFGLTSGLSIWFLELSLTLNVVLWLVLLLWRKVSIKHAGVALAGFVLGYGPAIFYNFTHNFANWRAVFVDKTGGGLGGALAVFSRPANFTQIFGREMPKFFGPDTVLWYYPEKPWTGFVFYGIALIAVAAALFPFVRRPSKLGRFFASPSSNETKDLLMLLLAVACFVPYLFAPVPTASYFFGGIFFLSILTGGLLARCFAAPVELLRVAGIALLVTIFAAGASAMIELARHNEIETLTLCDEGKSYCMTRIPGADLDCVERHLHGHDITSIWTTVSFTYPLLFETRETLAISDSIFGWDHNLYPPDIPPPQPSRDHPPVFVMESNSPLRRTVEDQLAEAAGAPPLITECGALVVIERR
jgi:hypothetical protein